jgi:anti-sigma factor RsiW
MSPGGAHLGSQVSALLDGQLPPEQAERAWRHVAACESCACAVHREGWVKQRLSRLADSTPPAGLTALLAGLPVGADDGARWPEPVRRGVGTRLTVAAIGLGSLSAALVVAGSGYLSEGSVEPQDPSAPAGALPVGSWIPDLTANVAAIDGGLPAHRVRQPWARMEP